MAPEMESRKDVEQQSCRGRAEGEHGEDGQDKHGDIGENIQRLSALLAWASFFSRTAPSPMRIVPMYFRTSIFISRRRDKNRTITLDLKSPISKNSDFKDPESISKYILGL